MAKRKLTADQIKKTTRPGLHALGNGLYLRVRRDGETGRITRSWIFRWRDPATLKLRDMGLGAVDDVPLGVARDAATRARLLVREGRDPIAERKAQRVENLAARAKVIAFDEAARLCHRAKSAEFKNAKHAAQWLSSIETYASPVIGRVPVGEVELAHVVRVLEPIWTTKTETASRLRGRIETVLEWARVAGYRVGGDNPAAWATLKHVLPAPGKLKRRRQNGGGHHPALPWPEVPAFMVELRKREGIAPRALEFAILTAARSGEVRLAAWDEIDLEAKLWTVPGERMKAGLPHRVPLSDAAVALLKALPRPKGARYIFSAPRGGALSDMALSAVVRRMHDDAKAAGAAGWLDPTSGRIATPHGFRSSFKDWARSTTSYADEVSELALAHVNSDATRAAYARDELLPKRERLMRDWARFCASPRRKASVTPIRGRR